MTYSVYILSNKWKTVFYVGITRDLEQRVFEHKSKFYKGFTSKYNCDCLMYYEDYSSVEEAIAREKQLKKYRREWKINLAMTMNSELKDIAADWFTRADFERYKKFEREPRRRGIAALTAAKTTLK